MKKLRNLFKNKIATDLKTLKSLLLFTLIGISFYSNGQLFKSKHSATLVLANNDTLHCITQVPNKFQRTIYVQIEDENLELDANSIKQMVLFHKKFGVLSYSFVETYKNFKYEKVNPNKMWCELHTNGKYLLYSVFFNPGATSSTNWYIRKCDEQIAKLIFTEFSSPMTINLNRNQNFRYTVSSYFKEYKDIASKIRNKEYKKYDIIEIVKMINKLEEQYKCEK